jgi:hypothetical protein
MTYQTDEKHINNLQEYFVGVVKLASYSLNTCLLLPVFINILLKYLSNRTSKTLKMLRLRVFGPPRLAPYQVRVAPTNFMPKDKMASEKTER